MLADEDSMMKHLLGNYLVSPFHHRFVPQRSCMTQQLECCNDWTNITDEGGRVDVAFLDISNLAYDTVPHKRLLSKLKSFNLDVSF